MDPSRQFKKRSRYKHNFGKKAHMPRGVAGARQECRPDALLMLAQQAAASTGKEVQMAHLHRLSKPSVSADPRAPKRHARSCQPWLSLVSPGGGWRARRTRWKRLRVGNHRSDHGPICTLTMRLCVHVPSSLPALRAGHVGSHCEERIRFGSSRSRPWHSCWC